MRYVNPLWNGYFADPFVMRVGEEYFAYGTGAAPLEKDGRAFPVLYSKDLSQWDYLGGALEAVAGATAYWAPEVAERGGRFYLYSSAAVGAGDQFHRLRVAVAERPQGPFFDSGRELLPRAGFSIDPHPFVDPKSGRLYLFFATDYPGEEPFGTGLAVVPMKDMLTADGDPTPVLRASHDWQIYERNRDYEGRIWPAWYTLEGPFVLYRQGRYWCLYSGGRWSGEGYGVSVAVSDHPMGPWHDASSGEGPSVLRGVPGRVIGPGHNSATVGPDGRTDILVYHAWDVGRTMRRLCIDPLRWSSEGPRCDGPSTEPRMLPEAAPDGR